MHFYFKKYIAYEQKLQKHLVCKQLYFLIFSVCCSQLLPVTTHTCLGACALSFHTGPAVRWAAGHMRERG